MMRILIVMTVIALAAISYGPVATLWNTTDYLGYAQCLTTMGTNTIGTNGFMPSVFYLCEDDAATDEAPAEEGKPDEPVPGIDRTWNVVMYG
jgi:hypothetical protein